MFRRPQLFFDDQNDLPDDDRNCEESDPFEDALVISVDSIPDGYYWKMVTFREREGRWIDRTGDIAPPQVVRVDHVDGGFHSVTVGRVKEVKPQRSGRTGIIELEAAGGRTRSVQIGSGVGTQIYVLRKTWNASDQELGAFVVIEVQSTDESRFRSAWRLDGGGRPWIDSRGAFHSHAEIDRMRRSC